MKNIIISIEGNIGSGKSTLLAALRQRYSVPTSPFSVLFLKEPVDDWETIQDEYGVTMLEKFYADQTKYSFSFQMMAYISRLQLLKSALKGRNNTIIVTERSLYTDRFVFAKMLYDTGKIERVNYAIYLKWFDSFAEDFPLHKVIYVRADPDICLTRIKKRQRAGEGNISMDYLRICDEYHQDMLCVENAGMPANRHQLVLDGNKDIYESTHVLDQWLRQVDAFISEKTIDDLV
jgi:deoxyadenosine/deoxycytidine kinase